MNIGARRLLVMMTDQRLTDPLRAADSLPRGAWLVLRFPLGSPIPDYAYSLRALCRRRSIIFLVSGDPALADKLRSDGIHLPEQTAKCACLSPILAWRRQKRGRLLTVAAHSRSALERAYSIKADAAFLSPVFATSSHPEAVPLGVLRLSRMARQARLPVVALGGITGANVRLLLQAPVKGYAAVSAFNV
jgi:thiamine-phosphate pyrophosphorylase